MADPNLEFYNKYLSVLKTKYNNLINDMIHLETQNLLLNDVVQSNLKEIEELKSEISKLSESNNKPKKSSTKTEMVEEQF
jgi:metal-responsive CopG/Arc/MetJ family transcriptional regulator